MGRRRMMKELNIRILIFLIILSVLFAGCQLQSDEGVVNDVVSKYVVSFSPSISPIRPVLETCAKYDLSVAIFIIESYGFEIESDLHFQAGEPSTPTKYLAQIATEKLNIIINSENQEILNLEKIINIFQGKILKWENGTEISRWVYPNFDDLQPFFDVNITLQNQLDRSTGIAPTSEIMIDIVGEDSGAIGILPGGWNSSNVRVVDMGIEIPILAIADTTPAQPLLNYLSCLQSAEIQELLSISYSPINP
jgi:hypothetical protein